ncbi:hypothetical protein METBIDRAFT_40166, partial [Metschnikowia bicuspidata var. bicuspidata NRRL YB-4993]
KKIAAPQFRIWSPTTLLSVALCSLTNVDRTGNSASCMVWLQPEGVMIRHEPDYRFWASCIIRRTKSLNIPDRGYPSPTV